MTRVDPERTVLYGILTLGTVAAAAGLAAVSWQPRAPTVWIAALVAAIVVGSAVLRVHRHGFGREGRYLDLWSIPHFLVGALLGLCGVGLVPLAVLVLAWELVEVVSRVFEYPTNRVVDVGLAIGGWCAVSLW